MAMHFRMIDQPNPDEALQQIFSQYWQTYRKWFLCDGEAQRPSYLTTRRMLETHMPELMPLYEQLLNLFDCDDLQSRFLGLYTPPPFAAGCTQGIWHNDPKMLVRNYDFPPHLCDRLVIKSNWLGTGVIAVSDCLWGALDGINEYGLTVSVAYGGRMVQGEGFGVALIIRYLLQTCRTTSDAVETLKRLPVHMDYNLAVLDRQGDYATVMIAPDRPVRVEDQRVSANRQDLDRPCVVKSLEDSELREAYLTDLMAEPNLSPVELVNCFLAAPLYRAEGTAATLYTAAYYPELGAVDYLWPSIQVRQSFDQFVSYNNENNSITSLS